MSEQEISRCSKAIYSNLLHLNYLDISYNTVAYEAIEYLFPTEGNFEEGCSKLAYLNLLRVKCVHVKLLKKLITALPKLNCLNELVVNAFYVCQCRNVNEHSLCVCYKTRVYAIFPQSVFCSREITVHPTLLQHFSDRCGISKERKTILDSCLEFVKII